MKRSKKTVFLALAVLAVLAVAALNFHKFSALAQTVVDYFSDSSKVNDTWNVEVDTASGVIRLDERSCDDGTWLCSASTTCANTFGDGDYIIVADTDLGSTKQWKTSQSDCDQPQCGLDGHESGDDLVADNTVDFSDYPAREACKALGGRLPTITELGCIYDNMADLGDNYNTSAYYWSSTENSETCARYVNFSSGNVNTNYKTFSGRVRCVLGW